MADYTWTADRLIHYPLVSSVAMSPCGKHVAYTVRVAHMTEDASEFRHELWLADISGGEPPRILAFGESAEQPRWSPDGARIAFLRKNGPDGHKGLFIISAKGGEAWPITASDPVHGDIATFRWSPDGKHIAFAAAPVDAEKKARMAARDDTIHWRVDDELAQLYVVPVLAPGKVTEAPQQRTSARRHVTSLAWSPDGDVIAYTHQSTSGENSWLDLELSSVPASGDAGEARAYGPVATRQGAPCWSPDGNLIACETTAQPSRWPFASTISLINASDGTRLELAQVSDEAPALLGWDAGGAGVYVLNQTGISTQVAYLPADGSAPTAVCSPGKLVTAADCNKEGKTAFVAEDFLEQQSIYSCALHGDTSAEPVMLGAPATDYPDGPLPQIRLLSWQTPDDLEIEGILYLPEGYVEEDGPIPLLLHVHGGPASIFQRQFAASPYYYSPAAMCERGIAVLRCNPRGSSGYGKEFRFANIRDWGGKDYQDLQQGVDTVVEMGIADPDRLGIAGWSYGGFMTSWTITQTDRFKAASIGAAVTNLASFCATSDYTDFIPDYFEGEAWEIPDVYREHSPITHVARANTPAIVQHGGADERVPLEQGLQYFNALQRRGVPVDMYIYPRQGHAINEPRLVADAIRRNLEWFSKMLVDAESA